MAHTCDAFIVSCIDFRFQKYVGAWLKKNMKGKTYDYVGFAGATKDLKTILNQLDISVRLHHVHQVILIHHEDCGAYGKESTHDRHAVDLHVAETAIAKKYPKLEVILYYLHLDGTFEMVE
jgi:carbonic anhydrase